MQTKVYYLAITQDEKNYTFVTSTDRETLIFERSVLRAGYAPIGTKWQLTNRAVNFADVVKHCHDNGLTFNRRDITNK